ncbi:hypothetical protein FGO68_gene10082 [Halteria grandinella]|uniref:Uncharacterized protein n=1 Tax=Halteria grandinella TaxID=5974 RepID=A0A8J8NH00_HALGN|nr:hypothetical protein FGO68_gene10082 [Halteria grandinella]
MKNILIAFAALIGLVICGTSGNIPQVRASPQDLCLEDCSQLQNDMQEVGYSASYSLEVVNQCKGECDSLIQVSITDKQRECLKECSSKFTGCVQQYMDAKYCYTTYEPCYARCKQL